MNAIGMPCAGCGKDLWYEIKADILVCLRCGRKIEQVCDKSKSE
jgi:DNA-directed RNA polymerase subunit RPC12/RpoP